MSELRVSPRKAIAWAFENYEFVVQKNAATGTFDLLWEKATSPEPVGGRAYMKHAANNPTHFFGTLVPKYLGDETGSEIPEEEVVEEKKSIVAIRKLLKQFTEPKG